MAEKTRLSLSLSRDEYESFENARSVLSMNRSQYLRFLISGQREIRPPAVREQNLIKALADVDMDLRIIAMKPSVSDEEKLLIMAKLDDLKKQIEEK